MTAPAFDFAPLSRGDIDAHCGRWIFEDSTRMARELRASRAALREWAEAADKGDLSRILPAEAKLRALVAHVGGGE